jgi:8-oxo-dGTP diphosphatase
MGLKKSAVFCVLKCEDAYLMLERNKPPHRGKMVPVGGKIEPFETPLSAVIRETYEETGLKVVSPQFRGILTETSPMDYNWISFIYSAEIDYCPPPMCNEGVLKWISKGELDHIQTPVSDRYIYQFINENRFFILDALYDDALELLEMRDELTGQSII